MEGKVYTRVSLYTGEMSMEEDERVGEDPLAGLEETIFQRVYHQGSTSTLRGIKGQADPKTFIFPLDIRRDDLRDPARRKAVEAGCRRALQANGFKGDIEKGVAALLKAMDSRAARTEAILKIVDPDGSVAQRVRDVLAPNWRPKA